MSGRRVAPIRSKSLTYMPALDGARAIAVLMVFVIHALPESGFPGGLGVDIFFVISGFLITRILVKEHNRTGKLDLKTFYIKRLLRLYPAFLVMVIVTVFLWWLLDVSFVTNLIYAAVSVTYLANIAMTVAGTGIYTYQHTWSLAMEEQFYLLWPVLLIGLLSWKWTRDHIILTLSVLTIASFAGWVLVGAEMPFNPLVKAGGLLFGCILAFLSDHAVWRRTSVGMIGVLGLAVAIALEWSGIIDRTWSLPLATVTAGLLIMHLAYGESPVTRVLSLRPLVWIGTVSYGFYLWHYPILLILMASFPTIPIVRFTIALALTLVVTMLSMRFIELPALRLKDRISRRQRSEVVPELD